MFLNDPSNSEVFTGTTLSYAGFEFEVYHVKRPTTESGRTVGSDEEQNILLNKRNAALRYFNASDNKRRLQAFIMSILRLFSRLETLAKQPYSFSQRDKFNIMCACADRDVNSMVSEAQSKTCFNDLVAIGRKEKLRSSLKFLKWFNRNY